MNVRIRYWLQETTESGRWCVSGIMTVETAKKIVNSKVYESAEIVFDEAGWPKFKELQPC